MQNIIKNGIKTYLQRTRIAVPTRSAYNFGKLPTEKKRLSLYLLTALIGTYVAHITLHPNPTLLPFQIPRIQAIEQESVRNKFNFIGSVVKDCAPAVVYIEIQDSKRLDPETNKPLILSNGSGFIIKEDGWVLTNAHVVINKPQAFIVVKMQNGSEFNATIEDADMNIDLALLKIETSKKLPALPFAKSNDINVGEWVIALGSPLSLSHSVTAGIISSTNRSATELGLRNNTMEYIQTDASITFGNSGGPLVNLDGDVIGINNLRITAGISFAIPIVYAKKFLRNGRHPLSEHNGPNQIDHIKQLGIATVQMTDMIIEELKLKENIGGVLVWKVILDSPAFRSGLQVGDIITHVSGEAVNHISEVYEKIKDNSAKMDIIRDGRRKEVQLNVK